MYFDWNGFYKMKFFKATVAYVGANYCGWQSQGNGNSIQEKIEAVLWQINQVKTNIIASGRTDAKVNAQGQVFSFQSTKNISAYQWLGIFHTFLPNDIYVRLVEEVDEDFHARFLVEQKTYVYYIHLGEYNVFRKDTYWQLNEKLDLEKMQQAWSLFLGVHNFLSFNRSNIKEYPNQTRHIYQVEMKIIDQDVNFLISGNGYLRHMVRTMVGTCVEVGRHKLTLADLQKMLINPSRSYATKRAPAQGLCLQNVSYHYCLARNQAYLLRTVSLYDALDTKICYQLHERKEGGKSFYFDQNGLLLMGQLPQDDAFKDIILKARKKGLFIH